MTKAAYQEASALWKKAKAKAEQEAAENRAAVLRHPDLATKLTQPPIGYTKPEQWTGYVPPETYDGVPNRSDRRAALFDIVLDALTRAEKP